MFSIRALHSLAIAVPVSASLAFLSVFYQFKDRCPQISITDKGLLCTSTANGFEITQCVLSAGLLLHNTCGIIHKAVFVSSPYLIFFLDVSNQNETRMVMSSYGSASKLHAARKQGAAGVIGSNLSSCCPNITTDQLQKPKYSDGQIQTVCLQLQM